MRSLPQCVSLMLERFFVNTDPIIWLTIFVLAVFVGIEVISKVSSTLHTPLMSGANAIHGVILVGAILVAGSARSTPILVLGMVAVILASINMVGGFVVTDRMLVMFARPKRALEKSGRRELEQ
jgi:proton-translocating NAD(P)+ transhydrogenase subunit alpha